MRFKYHVMYKGKEYKLKTKQDIMDLFGIPLYIVNKALRKSSDPNIVHKSAGHLVYQDFMTEVIMTLIKPEILIYY